MGTATTTTKQNELQPLHEVEARTWIIEPMLGAGDESMCLPGWIVKFCEAFEAEKELTLKRSSIRALLHTLIAARKRVHRLVQERNAYCDMVTKLQTQRRLPRHSKIHNAAREKLCRVLDIPESSTWDEVHNAVCALME